jgi:hypothetical protein
MKWPLIALAAFLMLSSPARAQAPIGFRSDLGVEALRGDPDSVFQGAVRGEFSFLYHWRRVHAGVGLSWVSFPVRQDKELDEEHWNFVGAHGLIGLSFPSWTLPLYAEARFIERRYRPVLSRYWDINSDSYKEERPFPQFLAYGVEGVAGLTLPFTDRTTVDVSGRASRLLWKDDMYLAGSGLIDMKRGWFLGLQAGLEWKP